MENSKLISLLRTFSKAEIRRFGEFTASPYFNKNEELCRFQEVLSPLGPEFPKIKIKKEKIFKKVFPGQDFDKKKLGYLMNALLGLAEQFIAQEFYGSQDMLNNCHKLRSFINRQLDKHYNYLFNKTQEQLLGAPKKEVDYFFYQYQLSDIAVNHFISQRVREYDPNLQLVSDQFDDFYFLNKLKYSCEMLNRQTILSADYAIHFMEEVQQYLLRRQDVPPLIEIYLSIFLTLEQPDETAHFDKLMALIEQHASRFSATVMREIYLYAINYCARRIRKGEGSYLPVVLNLYLEGIENKSLYEGQYLSHWTYTNVVKLALRLERYDWIEEFIHKQAVNLEPGARQDAEYFNLADLYYHKAEYSEVLDNLNKLQFTDINYHLGSRVLMIKTYYEFDAIEALLSMLASFSTYLRRNKKISLPLKKTYLNFCNLLHQVMRDNPKKREQVKADIKQMQPLAERAWLLKVWEMRGRSSK